MSLGVVLRRFYYSNLTCHPLGHVMVSDCHQMTHHAVEAGAQKKEEIEFNSRPTLVEC